MKTPPFSVTRSINCTLQREASIGQCFEAILVQQIEFHVNVTEWTRVRRDRHLSSCIRNKRILTGGIDAGKNGRGEHCPRELLNTLLLCFGHNFYTTLQFSTKPALLQDPSNQIVLISKRSFRMVSTVIQFFLRLQIRW